MILINIAYRILYLHRSLLLAALFLVLLVPNVNAQDPALSEASDFFLDRPDSNKYAVILVGPAVGDTNSSRFRQWALSLYDILARDYGYNSDTITLLYDRGEIEGPGGERVDAACDREGIEQQFAALKSRVKIGDQIILFLIGHGSGAEAEAKFNIVGPDLTGIEFAYLLDQFAQQDMVIVNTTSASYGFSAALSSEGRVVISSTRSSSEKYDPIFSRFFIEALDARNGDRDKNNRVSMLEAFNYARNNVTQWYEEQGRLAAEHAGLDDNGDSLFSLNPTVAEADGRLAEIAFIDTLIDSDEGLSEVAVRLKSRMQRIERSVFILRGRKADFLEADYWQQMEELLVDLARTTGRFNEQVEQ